MHSPEVQHEAKAGTDACVPERGDAALKEPDLDTGFLCPVSSGAQSLGDNLDACDLPSTLGEMDRPESSTAAEVEAVAREVSAVTTDDAILLMYAFSPGRRGPTPRGLSRQEVEAAYGGWRVVDEQPFDTSDMPAVFKKANPRWYRLQRDGSTLGRNQR